MEETDKVKEEDPEVFVSIYKYEGRKSLLKIWTPHTKFPANKMTFKD